MASPACASRWSKPSRLKVGLMYKVQTAAHDNQFDAYTLTVSNEILEAVPDHHMAHDELLHLLLAARLHMRRTV